MFSKICLYPCLVRSLLHVGMQLGNLEDCGGSPGVAHPPVRRTFISLNLRPSTHTIAVGTTLAGRLSKLKSTYGIHETAFFTLSFPAVGAPRRHSAQARGCQGELLPFLLKTKTRRSSQTQHQLGHRLQASRIFQAVQPHNSIPACLTACLHSVSHQTNIRDNLVGMTGPGKRTFPRVMLKTGPHVPEPSTPAGVCFRFTLDLGLLHLPQNSERDDWFPILCPRHY